MPLYPVLCVFTVVVCLSPTVNCVKSPNMSAQERGTSRSLQGAEFGPRSGALLQLNAASLFGNCPPVSCEGPWFTPQTCSVCEEAPNKDVLQAV